MKNLKEKQIQIGESTFVNVYKLILELNNYKLDEYTTELKNTIEEQITAKLEAMEKRKLYTAYKTAIPNTEEREIQRQKYLKKTEISKDWQTKKETPL